ncbi:NUDIX hydrolase [Ruegeria arenilitoris]|uniref:NUDIX hydrolase n=1 Tax=Ruegeria arenilitoris TaxID=1173585 RepID=UPI00147E05AC
MTDARLSARLQLKGKHLGIARQSAALCYRVKERRLEVLLITTRKSKRWIIPKGWLSEGMSAAQTATQEAWEEAGVRGSCAPDPMGLFTHIKNRTEKRPVLCQVDVFPLHVTSTSESFPEQGQRKSKWVSPKKAADLVNSPELSQLLRKLAAILH